MSLSQEDIKRIVREELTRIFVNSLDISFKEKEPELPTSKAWQALGFNSHRHLLKCVRNGFLMKAFTIAIADYLPLQSPSIFLIFQNVNNG